MADGEPFAFAGLWECWRKSPEPFDSCTIVTTDANELMQPIHDRMPVIVAHDDYDAWLAGEPEAAAELLRPYPPNGLTA